MRPLIITVALAYLLGSLPFGFLLVRIFRGEDIRRVGSGNIGATNVSRTSPALGVITLVLDALKGIAAVALTEFLFPGMPFLAAASGLFAVIGHVFPVWLSFRGGKGVATGLGAYVLLAPKPLLVIIAIFLILTIAFRYISLSSIVAVVLLPAVAILIERQIDRRIVAAMVATSLLIVLRHHANIGRLLAGTERRFAWKRS